MKIINFKPPVDKVMAEAELLEKFHRQLDEYVGVLTVVQVIGIIEIFKNEVLEDQKTS